MDQHGILPGDEQDVVQRLNALGEAPLPPGLAARCLDRARGKVAPRTRRFGTKVLVAASMGGFVFGGVGLAAADVLPAPVQDVAHTALDRVGVHVPPGHDRYNDPVACPAGPYRNHGAYVRSHKSDPAAGKSPCGKPVKSVHPSGDKKSDDGNKPDKGAAGHGPPPWAHNKDKTNKNKDKQTAKNETPDQDTKQPEDTTPGPAVTTPASSTSTTTTTSTPPDTSTSTSSTSTSSP